MSCRRSIQALIVAAVAIALAPPVAADGSASERERGLLELLRQDCGSCHGMTMRGGLGPALLPATLDDIPDEVLVQIILDGVPETPMPPWRPLLKAHEAAWMVKQLKDGLK
ncbi:MAG: cytochrome c [Rhodospirillales bacterium]|nr:cytochrome c [Rhodospirillales bacterium]